MLTGASRERPKGLGCKSPRSFKGVGRCQSGIHHRIWLDPFGQVCQTIAGTMLGHDNVGTMLGHDYVGPVMTMLGPLMLRKAEFAHFGSF